MGKSVKKKTAGGTKKAAGARAGKSNAKVKAVKSAGGMPAGGGLKTKDPVAGRSKSAGDGRARGNQVENLEWVRAGKPVEGGGGKPKANKNGTKRMRMPRRDWVTEAKGRSPVKHVGQSYWVKTVDDLWRPVEAVYMGQGRWKVDGKSVKVERVIGDVGVKSGGKKKGAPGIGTGAARRQEDDQTAVIRGAGSGKVALAGSGLPVKIRNAGNWVEKLGKNAGKRRPEGFYWARLKKGSKDIVAEWRGRAWFITGGSNQFDDGDFEWIG